MLQFAPLQTKPEKTFWLGNDSELALNNKYSFPNALVNPEV